MPSSQIRLSMALRAGRAQTMARVWDALFSEGPKILYRVALTLLKDCAPEALAADNTGDLISAIKASCHVCHDRDALMKVRRSFMVCCTVIAPDFEAFCPKCHDRDTLRMVRHSFMAHSQRLLSTCFTPYLALQEGHPDT